MVNYDATRREVRQALGLDSYGALLGDGNGLVPVGNRPGYVYIRGKQDKRVKIVLMRANIPLDDGIAVRVGFVEGVESVIGRDYANASVQGDNTFRDNPNVGATDQWIAQQRIATMVCYPMATADSDSMVLTVRGYFYEDAEGKLQSLFNKAIDLTSLVPSAGEHRYVSVFKKRDNTLESIGSTAKPELDPLTIADIQETLDGRTAGAQSIWTWRLYGGQTTISAKDDQNLDLRQFIATQPRKHNLNASSNPGTGDDDGDGYEIGSVWINTSSGSVWLCVDASTGAAVWKDLTASGGSSGGSFDVGDGTNSFTPGAQVDWLGESPITVDAATQDEVTIGLGTVPVTKGGTGLTSVSALSLLFTSASNTFSALTAGSDDYYKAPVFDVTDDLNYFAPGGGVVVSEQNPSGAASITFTGLGSLYTKGVDAIAVRMINGTSSTTAQFLNCEINGTVTGATNYILNSLSYSGGAASGASSTNTGVSGLVLAGTTSGATGSGLLVFHNPATVGKFKLTSTTTVYWATSTIRLDAIGLYTDLSTQVAITSIVLKPAVSGSFSGKFQLIAYAGG